MKNTSVVTARTQHVVLASLERYFSTHDIPSRSASELVNRSLQLLAELLIGANRTKRFSTEEAISFLENSNITATNAGGKNIKSLADQLAVEASLIDRELDTAVVKVKEESIEEGRGLLDSEKEKRKHGKTKE